MYFNNTTTNLSQTLALCMFVFMQHVLQILLKQLTWYNIQHVSCPLSTLNRVLKMPTSCSSPQSKSAMKLYD